MCFYMSLCPLTADLNSVKIPGRYVFLDIMNTISINILLNIHQYNNRMTGIPRF